MKQRPLVALGALVVVAIAVIASRRTTPPAETAAAPAPVAARQPVAAPAPIVMPAPAPPKRVVIISEDGLRPDVLSEELTPRHVALIHEGARAKDAETIPESDTLPSHASMLSGVGAREH